MDDGGLNMKFVRDLVIVSVICFSLGLSLYVSIPDYPHDASACEILLWGEASQWWSEMTWICAFCVLSISSLYLISWNSEVKSTKVETLNLDAFRFFWVVSVISILFHYSAYYFKWTDWESFFLKDSTGYLHGAFYIFTFLLGLLAFGELIAYASKVQGYLLKLSKLSPLE